MAFPHHQESSRGCASWKDAFRVTSYYLDLVDVNIDKKPVGFLPNTFQIFENGTDGFTIDTGSTVTRLRAGEFDQMTQAMIDYLRKTFRRRPCGIRR
ncbi:hypothetical protein COCNU_04G008970 [Cocos nucifera]|uniref:Xylanase inhibitor C-terminal domain-containing protein n=1 Tax=Cocos nucifera TaxID=13894 RepID=A0A8K0I665_COCNU|nr:hypothetical protein COCNU_04G008970 [Cocos nucifera]